MQPVELVGRAPQARFLLEGHRQHTGQETLVRLGREELVAALVPPPRDVRHKNDPGGRGAIHQQRRAERARLALPAAAVVHVKGERNGVVGAPGVVRVAERRQAGQHRHRGKHGGAMASQLDDRDDHNAGVGRPFVHHVPATTDGRQTGGGVSSRGRDGGGRSARA